MAHQLLAKGMASDGTPFHLMHHRDEVHLYWPDGEMSAQQLLRGDDPQLVANEWKEQITADVIFNKD